MYEAPAYWELKKHLQHWEVVRRYVDLARTFRSMAYGGDLTLTAAPGRHHTEELQVSLSDSLRTDALNFLAERCEEVALKIAQSPPAEFSVSDACKV